MFEIRPAAPYPEDYLTEPALEAKVPGIAGYTTVFLGVPIWGETAPPIIRSFLSAHDLSGKTLIPFITHGGYGLGDSGTVMSTNICLAMALAFAAVTRTSLRVALAFQRRFHGVEQRTQAKRHVLDAAIDVEGRRGANTTFAPGLHVFSNPMQVNMSIHLGRVARQIEVEPLCIAAQRGELQMGLVLEKQFVHPPKLPLAAGAFCGFGGLQRVWMDFLERKMAKHKAYTVFETVHQ
jgi:flavodoxin-like protein